MGLSVGDVFRFFYWGCCLESSCGVDGDYEDVELNFCFLKDNLINVNGGSRLFWLFLEY